MVFVYACCEQICARAARWWLGNRGGAWRTISMLGDGGGIFVRREWTRLTLSMCRRVCNLGIDSATIADTQRCHKPRSCACAPPLYYICMLCVPLARILLTSQRALNFSLWVCAFKDFLLPAQLRACIYIRNVLRDRELCAYGHNVECVCVRERKKLRCGELFDARFPAAAADPCLLCIFKGCFCSPTLAFSGANYFIKVA